ncbi:ras-related protein RABC2a-like [Aplysia californica]|uniref:Ras-related protein RABC2a-like n=1 Tax=Aplysia californica TaxID=6500 RepID=A0ABM1W333_APLCA|nr:ras-related protein RABC2a-like [Aplysia californica]
MTSTRFDFTVKIIVLGDRSVGKSSFLALLADHDPDVTGSPTRCLDYRPNGHVEMDMCKNGKRILAKVADTGGQERFRSITASFYRGSQGCLLMFDAEKPDTFSHVYTWHTDLEMYTSKQPMSTTLVGVNSQSNKRQIMSQLSIVSKDQNLNCLLCSQIKISTISPDQAERLASQLDMQYLELDLSPTRKSLSAVKILESLIGRIILHASRLPSLTIDIIPHQLKQHLEDLHKHALEEGQPNKFKCSC